MWLVECIDDIAEKNVVYSIIYYGEHNIITADINFILTPTADSGFVLNFKLRY